MIIAKEDGWFSSWFVSGEQLWSLFLFLSFFFFFFNSGPLNFYLFIYLFMAVLGLRFCARAFSSCGKQGPLFTSRCAGLSLFTSRCAGLSLSRPLLLQSTGCRRAGSVVVAHGPSCSTSCGIFPDQGSNPCPLHWQADSQPLRHQGSSLTFVSSLCSLLSAEGSLHCPENHYYTTLQPAIFPCPSLGREQLV